MLSSKGIKEIVMAARPIIERQLDDAEMIAAFRDKIADAGGDWSALKALIKAQIQDERDETGEGKRVKKILDKAGFSTDYAELLGWAKMNEKNFSAEEEFDPITGEFVEREKAIEEKCLAGALSAALGVEVEIVRTNSNPVANVEEGATGAIAAASSDPASRTDEDGERQHSSTVGFADDCRTGGKEQSAAAAAPEGDAGAYAEGIPATNSEKGAVATVATVFPSAERVTPHRSGSADANAGGGHVNAQGEAAQRAGALVKPAPAHKPLRPLCRNPGEHCGGYGSHHCSACLRVSKETEVAA